MASVAPVDTLRIESTNDDFNDNDQLLNGVFVKTVTPDNKLSRNVLTISEGRFGAFLTICSSSGNGLMARSRSLVLSVDLGLINQVQRGTEKSEDFAKTRDKVEKKNKKRSPFDPSKCICITYSVVKVVTLLLPSNRAREDLVDALVRKIKSYQGKKTTVVDDVQLMRYVWSNTERQHPTAIEIEEFPKLLHNINLQLERHELLVNVEKFRKKYDLEKSFSKKGITFDHSVMFLRELKNDFFHFKPAYQLWNNLFGKANTTVSAKVFLENFLHKTQGETDATLDYVQDLFTALNQVDVGVEEPSSGIEPQSYIDKPHFEAYLSSRFNDAFSPQKEKCVPYDMSQPLSDYFINSSYISASRVDHVQYDSLAEVCLRALHRGARCLHLDVWDGTQEGPVVYEDAVMSKEVPFHEVIVVINNFLENSFGEYPVILSLRNHCNSFGQKVIAKVLSRVLGEKLYVPDESASEEKLESPESLRGMVIITVQQSSSKTRKQGRDVMVPELADITCVRGVKFAKWHESETNPVHAMHSFKDTHIEQILTHNHGEKMHSYNHHHLSRVYAATDNFSPLMPWSMGCQLVLLDPRSRDSHLLVNDGFFRQNGNCGYILKSKAFMDTSLTAMSSQQPVLLSVTVLNGSCLPKPLGKNIDARFDPYVEVTLYDVDYIAKTEVSTSNLTHSVEKNGYFPVWNDDFQFSVKNESVATLLFSVRDMDEGENKLVASAAIPVSCLRSGYRSVRLFDVNNDRSGSFKYASLLIKVQVDKKAIIRTSQRYVWY